MNKFLLGLLLGTLLGFAFAELVRNKIVEPTAPTANRSIASPANDAAANPSLPGGAVSGAQATRNSSQADALTTPAAASSAIESTSPATEQHSAASTSAPRATDAAPTSSASSRTPIAVPDAIKSFLEKTDTHDGLTLGQIHAKLEDEADDLAWSYQMEMYLQQSFARPTKSGQPLDIRVIECRTTMCEIVGFSPLLNPTDDLSGVVQQMSQQPWWDFDSFNTSAEGADNSGKFLIFLRRKR